MQATFQMESETWFLEAAPKQKTGFWNRSNKAKLTQNNIEKLDIIKLWEITFLAPTKMLSGKYPMN